VSVLTAIRAAWHGAPPRAAVAAGDADRVRLIVPPPRAPETPIERRLVEALASHGPLSSRALVTHVAVDLYHDELAHGGWLADLGILGERPFIPDVARALAAGAGALWRIETDSGRRG
jgi:hypothetical protein